MGIEPTYTGFADLRVSHFATGACPLKLKNPPRLGRVGRLGSDSWFLNLAQRTRPRGAAMTAAAQTAGGSEKVGHKNSFPREQVFDASTHRITVD